MNENRQIAVFRGHKVRNEHKCIVRFYDNPTQPWTVLAYDEVYSKLYTVPKGELYDYVVSYLFNNRRLWTTGAELDALFNHVEVPYGTEHPLKTPEIVDTVCFLKHDSIEAIANGKLSYSKITTLHEPIAKRIRWNSPHVCIAIKDNTTGKVVDLFITLSEYNSVVYANPEYFDVKDKTR